MNVGFNADMNTDMNAVGRIGQFMINNQFAIDALLIAVLGIIVVYWLYKRLSNNKKNSITIDELSKKIDQIENHVREIATEDPKVPKEPKEFFVEEDSIKDDNTVEKLFAASVVKGPKYASRDWNEDRYGNMYTEEMLKELIG